MSRVYGSWKLALGAALALGLSQAEAASLRPGEAAWVDPGKVTTNLRLRSAPTTSAARLGLLSPGTAVKVLQVVDRRWVEVDVAAYCDAGRYLRLNGDGLTARATANLTVRDRPTAVAEKLGHLVPGDEVRLRARFLNENKRWVRLRAYVSSEYLTAELPETLGQGAKGSPLKLGTTDESDLQPGSEAQPVTDERSPIPSAGRAPTSNGTTAREESPPLPERVERPEPPAGERVTQPPPEPSKEDLLADAIRRASSHSSPVLGFLQEVGRLPTMTLSGGQIRTAVARAGVSNGRLSQFLRGVTRLDLSRSASSLGLSMRRSSAMSIPLGDRTLIVDRAVSASVATSSSSARMTAIRGLRIDHFTKPVILEVRVFKRGGRWYRYVKYRRNGLLGGSVVEDQTAPLDVGRSRGAAGNVRR